MNTIAEREFAEELYYMIYNIKDPEKPYCTLSQLGIVCLECLSYEENTKVLTK
jgi:hypothetical protein